MSKYVRSINIFLWVCQKLFFSSIFLIEVIVMDKNIVKELGQETLIKIILRL